MKRCTCITFYFKEGFRNKGLNSFEPFHHKTKCRELAAPITDELTSQRLWEDFL